MRFTKTSKIEASARDLFDWHARPGAFARLTPPWQTVEVVREDPGLQVGKQVELKMDTPVGKKRWLAEHIGCVDGVEFTDIQREGPFKRWQHRHLFRHIDDRNCELVDEIEYELPFGLFGKSFGSGYVEKQLSKGFEYRHWITQRDMAFCNRLPRTGPLKVLITGGTGFLGSRLGDLLRSQGHEVSVVTRSKRSESDVRWDPQKGEVERSRLEGCDALVHLAGESLTSGRWTESRKRSLWSSRVDATSFLVDTLSRLESPPKVLLSGSGIGYYGSDPERVFDESAKRGEGFLAELCEAWEAQARRAETLGTRVVLLRTGVVVDPRGGALKQMLPAFRMGGGGPIGDGEQWFPWIGLEDWIRAVVWCAQQKKVAGPVNLAAPGIVRQKEFASELGHALGRPSFLPAPKFALSAVFGEMAEAALFSSIRAEPAALQQSGYEFELPRLDAAFRRVL